MFQFFFFSVSLTIITVTLNNIHTSVSFYVKLHILSWIPFHILPCVRYFYFNFTWLDSSKNKPSIDRPTSSSPTPNCLPPASRALLTLNSRLPLLGQQLPWPTGHKYWAVCYRFPASSSSAHSPTFQKCVLVSQFCCEPQLHSLPCCGFILLVVLCFHFGWSWE